MLDEENLGLLVKVFLGTDVADEAEALTNKFDRKVKSVAASHMAVAMAGDAALAGGAPAAEAGVGAVLKIKHPTLNTPPKTKTTLAEAKELMPPIGRWTFLKESTWHTRWHSSYPYDASRF